MNNHIDSYSMFTHYILMSNQISSIREILFILITFYVVVRSDGELEDTPGADGKNWILDPLVPDVLREWLEVGGGSFLHHSEDILNVIPWEEWQCQELLNEAVSTFLLSKGGGQAKLLYMAPNSL